MLKTPTLKEIDKIRKNGFRPQAVACIVEENAKKILFVFQRKYKLWQFPQGGIDNQEEIKKALLREMEEELGKELVKQLRLPKEYLICEKSIEFTSSRARERPLQTDTGGDIKMKGKHYYFSLMYIDSEIEIDLDKSEFDDYLWSSYQQAKKLTEWIYQKQKRAITREVLEILKEKSTIS